MVLAYGDVGIRRTVRVCSKCGTTVEYERVLFIGETRGELRWNQRLGQEDRRLVKEAIRKDKEDLRRVAKVLRKAESAT